VNPHTGESCNIAVKTFCIGKTPENNCRIKSDVVSRKHAVIRWIQGEYYIEDLNSFNGTFVNGRKIGSGPAKLKSHDLITFADVEMEFVLKEVKPNGICGEAK
jgi:pSer/pThr/pTyr-binding forkhead associated (FHA) protein